jgi:hypothetical protein
MATKKTSKKSSPEVTKPQETAPGTFKIDSNGKIHQTGFVSTTADLLAKIGDKTAPEVEAIIRGQ